MANYCNNMVAFHGPEENLCRMRECFADIAKLDYGMPAFIQSDRGHFIRLSLNEDKLSYITHYSPNLNVVLAVAEHFDLDYQHDYVETGLLLYGQTSKKGEQTEHFRLTPADHRLLEFDMPSEQVFYNGEFYGAEWEAWPVMLADKKAAFQSEAVQRRLAGELPRIDLDGSEFIIDYAKGELIEVANPRNFIDFRNISYDQEWQTQFFVHDRESHRNYPNDPGSLPDSYCFMLTPDKYNLDPVGAALAEKLPPGDLLLSHPYKEHHIARTAEIAATIQQQHTPKRGR